MKIYQFFTIILLWASVAAQEQNFQAAPPSERPNAAELAYFGGQNPNVPTDYCVAAGNGNRDAGIDDSGNPIPATGSILVGTTEFHPTQNGRAGFSNFGSPKFVMIGCSE